MSVANAIIKDSASNTVIVSPPFGDEPNSRQQLLDYYIIGSTRHTGGDLTMGVGKEYNIEKEIAKRSYRKAHLGIF